VFSVWPTTTPTNTIDVENLDKEFLVSGVFINEGLSAFVIPWRFRQGR
jgi:hypothetical protein